MQIFTQRVKKERALLTGDTIYKSNYFPVQSRIPGAGRETVGVINWGTRNILYPVHGSDVVSRKDHHRVMPGPSTC